MVFSSSIFLFVFLPVVLIIYYNPIFKGRKFKNYFLLLASLLFYAWGEPVFVFLMIISIVITWLAGLILNRTGGYISKAVLSIGIVYHVVILFVFKYLSFTAQQLGLFLNKDFSSVSISLPIGISFFTFQLMSYLFDIYYKRASAQRNILYVGLYVSLFPQLIAGPIVRYEKIADEITQRYESYDEVIAGMKRFIYGLAKKVLLSNYMAQISDNVFDYMAGSTTVALAWLGAICYTLQIYYDFSGYSDMAIGLGRMFGFHFDENFNYPYISKSITEFWRRWHISLSSWFRDYVYIPLGGNRVSKIRWVFNIFIVWLFTGIWHGANWTFIAWGMIYFVILLIEKLTGFPNKLGNIASHIYTMFVVIIAWVVFRADSIGTAMVYIENMFGIGSTGVVDVTVLEYVKSSALVLVASCFGITPCIKQLSVKIQAAKAKAVELIWVCILFVLSLIMVISSTYNPFIYYNF